MPVSLSCDLTETTTPITHFWEHTVGCGDATLALRADWKAQLRRVYDELGFRHMPFHGLLYDDFGTLIAEGDTLFYSFFNAASICQRQLQPFEIQGNIITLELTLPQQAVAAVTIECASLLS